MALDLSALIMVDRRMEWAHDIRERLLHGLAETEESSRDNFAQRSFADMGLCASFLSS